MSSGRYRVWCPERGETHADAKCFGSSSYRGAAEFWAESLAGFCGDPFTEITCVVEEWVWNRYANPKTMRVTVRAEPVFEAHEEE